MAGPVTPSHPSRKGKIMEGKRTCGVGIAKSPKLAPFGHLPGQMPTPGGPKGPRK
jgi:hypothetical protein